MGIDAVVFDLDMTLAVPDRDRETLLEEAAIAVGAPPLSRDRYLEVHRHHHQARTRGPIFVKLLDDHDTSVDPVALTEAYRSAIIESIDPVPGAESTIEELRDEYRVGLLTNGPVRTQREKLETLGWADLFEAIVITGELPAGKPAPDAFEAILEELAVDPEATVYVGDDVEMDIGGATAAGMTAIQVCYPGGPTTDDRAVASVDRATIADSLPLIVRSLDLFDSKFLETPSP